MNRHAQYGKNVMSGGLATSKNTAIEGALNQKNILSHRVSYD